MKKKSCPFEKEVLDGLSSGELTPEANEHAESCAVCKESIAIYRWMNRFQTVSLETNTARKILPDAESIWEGAFSSPAPVVNPTKELEKKALIPLLFPQVLAYAAAIVVVIYLVISNIPGIQGFVKSNPETLAIITYISTMVKTVFKSSSALAIPAAVSLLAMVIFVIVAAFEDRKLRIGKQYIF
ncbi:MAG: hypothetical protein QG657_5016 [Acidobacteriota bacterium]|nr:hypothetical protein [Acidobacteriota bacterium]